MNPLISIIVPVYNVELYIETCVHSLLEQSYQNIEIILVNDGSLDNSGDRCDDLALLDSRIVVIHQDNGGLSAARNAGLDVCKGTFIAFVDSDDFVHPDFIQYLYTIIGSADMAACGFESFEEESEVGKALEDERLIHYDGTSYLKELIYLDNPDFVVAWNKLYKRDLWSTTRFVKGVLHEDEFVIHHLAQQCSTIHQSNRPYYYYRKRPESITSSQRNERSFLDKLAAFYDRYLFYTDLGMDVESKVMLRQVLERCALPTVRQDNQVWYALRDKGLFFQGDGLSLKTKAVLLLKVYCYPVYRAMVSLLK